VIRISLLNDADFNIDEIVNFDEEKAKQEALNELEKDINVSPDIDEIIEGETLKNSLPKNIGEDIFNLTRSCKCLITFRF